MVLLFKRLLLGLLLAILLLPAVQAELHWVKEKPLNGAFEVAPPAKFNAAGLLANAYQPALERYLEDRIGFRSILIRLRNQLQYSLFQMSPAANFAVGRHRTLFEQAYIDAYLGTDYVGDDQVRFNARRFRSVQDTLANHGVRLVFVIAPSKATFMPENLPPAVRQRARARSNYAAYAQALPAAGVHLLDLSRAFRQWKRTSPYPLFAPGGTHWSLYGGARAADSLRAYLHDSLQLAPAAFGLGQPELTTKPRDTDADIAAAMNLLFAPRAGTLAYPRLEFHPRPAGPPKPNLLLVADSFGWTWITNGFFDGAFADQSRYWYYNGEVAWPGPERTPEGRDINQLKRREQYLARDVVVLMFSEYGLAEFDRGFSRELYTLFRPYTPAEQAHYVLLVEELRQKAAWEDAVKDGFEQRISTTANARLDRERFR